DERCEGRFLLRHGHLFWEQEQYKKALTECLQKTEEIALRYNDNVLLGRIAEIQSDILSEQGHLQEAEQLAGTILDIGEQLNHLELKHLAAYLLASYESKNHQLDKALAWLDQSEKWCKELDWKRGEAWIMYL